MTLIFRADASYELGLGHLIRCLHLAKCASRYKPRIIFVLKYAHAKISELVGSEGYEIVLLNAKNDAEEFTTLSQFGNDNETAFIFDVCHQKTLANPMAFESLTRQLASGKQTSVLIDGLGQHSLSAKINPQVDFVLIPYGPNSTTDVDTETGHCTYMRGIQYFICHPDFQRVRHERKTSAKTRRLLVSCGGSDPRRITSAILKELEDACNGLEIKVVIGPAFDAAYVESLKAFASQLNNNACSFIFSPPTLADQIAWADLAVGTSGLSKYEFAISGLPAVLISIDQAHAEISEEFITNGSAIHAGLFDDLPVDHLGDLIQNLFANEDLRMDMAKKGLNLSKGDGGFIIMDKIRERQIWKKNN